MGYEAAEPLEVEGGAPTAQELPAIPPLASSSTSAGSSLCCCCDNFISELLTSADILFRPKISWLLVFGLVAVIGSKTGLLGEAVCFMLSGVALIPCAERYDKKKNSCCWPPKRRNLTNLLTPLCPFPALLRFILLLSCSR